MLQHCQCPAGVRYALPSCALHRDGAWRNGAGDPSARRLRSLELYVSHYYLVNMHASRVHFRNYMCIFDSGIATGITRLALCGVMPTHVTPAGPVYEGKCGYFFFAVYFVIGYGDYRSASRPQWRGVDRRLRSVG